MSLLTRRNMLKNAALPIAGTFALRSLAAAVQDVTAPYQRPKLKITDVRTAQVRVHGLQTDTFDRTDAWVEWLGYLQRKTCECCLFLGTSFCPNQEVARARGSASIARYRPNLLHQSKQIGLAIFLDDLTA